MVTTRRRRGVRSVGMLRKDYEVIEKLGDGSSGLVVRARRRKDRKDVAVKIVKKSLLSDKMREVVANEAKVLKDVNHGSIVKLLDVIENDDTKCLVMEYLLGTDLQKQFHFGNRRFTETEALQVTEGVVEALVYLHTKGIAHRDLKLENIILEESDCSRVKIIDFGMAHERVSNGELCIEKCGTSQYMSPQMVQGVPYEPEKVDMWCLGIIMYTLIEGSLPFDSPSPAELIRTIVLEEVLLDSLVWKNVSDGTKRLVRSLLSKDPAKRPDALRCLYAVQDNVRRNVKAAASRKEIILSPVSSLGLSATFSSLSGALEEFMNFTDCHWLHSPLIDVRAEDSKSGRLLPFSLDS